MPYYPYKTHTIRIRVFFLFLYKRIKGNSLSNLNFTKCFMGANGIDLEKGFTTPDMDEALIKEEIVNHSNDVYVLADSSKFDQVFAVTFTKLKGKCIITDQLDNDLYRKHAIVKEANK